MYTPTEVWINIALLLCIATVFLLVTRNLLFFTPSRRQYLSVINKQTLFNPRHLLHKRLSPKWSGLWYIQKQLSLWSYHLRVAYPFLLRFLIGGLLITSLLLMLVVHNGNDEHNREFVCYVLESGIALVAGILTSSAVTGDPAREMLVCSQRGVRRIVWGRIILSLLLLACTATCFLLLSLTLRIHYSTHDTLILLFALWLIPSFLSSMIGLLGAMLTKSSALGSTFVGFFLLLPHFARDIIMNNPVLQLFCIPLTLFQASTNLWWWNRLTLLGGSLLLLLVALWMMKRDELLIESNV